MTHLRYHDKSVGAFISFTRFDHLTKPYLLYGPEQGNRVPVRVVETVTRKNVRRSVVIFDKKLDSD